MYKDNFISTTDHSSESMESHSAKYVSSTTPSLPNTSPVETLLSMLN